MDEEIKNLKDLMERKPIFTKSEAIILRRGITWSRLDIKFGIFLRDISYKKDFFDVGFKWLFPIRF